MELRRIQQMLRENENKLMEKWNAEFSEIKPGERVKNVSFTEDTLAVDLVDGRTIVVPLVWYPRLLSSTLVRSSAKTGRSALRATASIGRTLTRT